MKDLKSRKLFFGDGFDDVSFPKFSFNIKFDLDHFENDLI